MPPPGCTDKPIILVVDDGSLPPEAAPTSTTLVRAQSPDNTAEQACSLTSASQLSWSKSDEPAGKCLPSACPRGLRAAQWPAVDGRPNADGANQSGRHQQLWQCNWTAGRLRSAGPAARKPRRLRVGSRCSTPPPYAHCRAALCAGSAAAHVWQSAASVWRSSASIRRPTSNVWQSAGVWCSTSVWQCAAGVRFSAHGLR